MRERIAHYRFEQVLGVGGMGEVYQAFDERLERRVAIKLVASSRALDASVRARMLREARIASALQHPGIVTVHEIGDDGNQTYIVMELVEGETLAQRLAGAGRLPPREAVELIAQVADAVGAAHDAGILHRDLKPANLVIDRRGRVKVLDFGLSKRVGRAATPPPVELAADEPVADGPISADAPTAMPRARSHGDVAISGDGATAVPLGSGFETVDGARMGTPGYAPLELLEGRQADVRTDVFSLAVVLYELVTGRLPYPAPSWSALHDALQAGRFTPASQASDGAVDARFDAALAPALAPASADRPGSVGALVERVRAALASPSVAAATPVPPVPRPRRAPWLIGAGVLAVGGAVTVALAMRPTDAPARPPVATLDAGAAPAPPRALTTDGGCAYSPAFLDDERVGYDLTDGDRVDLMVIEARGGASRRVVASPAMEWRASPGPRPGELAYIVTETTEGGANAVDAVDPATGATRRLVTMMLDSFAFRGDTMFYPGPSGADIRRRTDAADEVVATMPPERIAHQIALAPDGRHLAIQATTITDLGVLCVASLGDGAVTCPVERIIGARAAWSADSTAIYYSAADGIRRHRLGAAGDDELVVPGVIASGGVAVSPTGRTLVWSACRSEGRITSPMDGQAEIALDDAIRDLVLAPDGSLIWIRSTPAGRAVVRRLPDGKLQQLTDQREIAPHRPSVSPDGTMLAMLLGGTAPGLYLQTIATASRPHLAAASASVAEVRWLDNDRIAFSTWDDRNVYWIHIHDRRDGSTVRLDAPRLLWGVHPQTGELLVSHETGARMFWRNPATGAERALPAPSNLAMVHGVFQSPSRRWLVFQEGQMANRAVRVDLLASQPAYEVVHEAGQDVVVTDLAVRDDGTVIVASNLWTGELFARDGAF